MYQVEFKAMNAKLLMDPKRQIILDQNMMAAIDELMQVRPCESSLSMPRQPIRVPDEEVYSQLFLDWKRPEMPPPKAPTEL